MASRATRNSRLKTQNHAILALDVGTSSTRAIVFDAAGRKVGPVAQRPYEQATTPDGGVEVDADSLLEWTALCLDEALHNLDGDQTIIAVATSCFWHSLLAVGPDGRALTPVFSWADNRAAPWVGPLRAALDEGAAHARTGCAFHTSYWPAKLLWLHRARPELFANGTRWMSFGEYLALQLCGETHASLSMASGTGLFHQSDCRWDGQTLTALPIDESHLSPLCDAHEPLGQLRAPWRARWPALRGAKWFPALGDGACSNIGSGCADARSIAMNVGTSGALRVVLEDYLHPAPHGLWRYRVDRRRSVLGGALSNAGNVLMWARATLALPDDAEVQMAALAADAHGLTVLPFLAGERSPDWNARARMVIEGATLNTSPVEVLRACLEAASLRFTVVARMVQNVMAQNVVAQSVIAGHGGGAVENAKNEEAAGRGGEHPPIVTSGGALEVSSCWRQIMCDCLGVPLVESCEAEASARGAALLALEACGVIEDVARVPTERGAMTMPDAARHAVYTRALARQNALYERTFGELAAES